ncbi:SDR family oxidoreductase [Actinophytocola oryzae]|uniref:NADP-dependent 3-hydroxy acid dehydrogenase YdfG n=1 Tax=Actinophytocola oryzae TaxID=502181 RepID=A0A4R7VYS4_9PSEU|nr:SDR family oxidoreductase [Actinophytocola oryzae]TDV55316.1 NADP-dependent 3-hydroxy acid dehydrogenase YdfG [Actinophytocola oryzae]
MPGIEGKVVAVTGASSGIGEATAVLLAEHGAKLVLGARREERLAALAHRLGDAAYLAVDVRRRADVADLVALARKRFDRLDVLVSNAGVMPISPLDDLRVDEWDAMVDVNLKGVLHGIAAALPVFRDQGGGHFVNVASTAGLRVSPAMAVYAGTKFAVRAVSEGLRQEAGDRLRVTIISPGMTRTNFADTMTNPAVRAELAESRDRMAMPPDAVARAIAYAVEQPADIDVGEVVVRPTAQA